ncbi:MAG: hypothetical protein M3R44_02295, partial [Candidatus Eremiobacteraeota bacterium]|nr:hypothetical protein [Candidatus Eremiobacteraeota bacterium]
MFALPVWSFAEEYVVRGAMDKRVADASFLVLFAILAAFGYFNRLRRGHEVLAVGVAILLAAYIAI